MGSHVKKVESAAGGSSGTELTLDVEDFTFSETNPRFSIVLSKKHVGKSQPLQIPMDIQQHLSNRSAPTRVKCYGKIWEMSYSGDREYKAMKPKGWHNFVADNELKIGDAVFLELLDVSESGILFKAVLIKTDQSTRTAPPTS